MNNNYKVLANRLDKIFEKNKNPEVAQKMRKYLENLLYYYLHKIPLIKQEQIPNELKDILTEDNIEQIESEVKETYFKYLEGPVDYKNIDDAYFKGKIEEIKQMERRQGEIELKEAMMENPRTMQRMCEIIVSKSYEKIKSQNKLQSSYMAAIAKTSKENSFLVATALSKAEKLKHGLENHFENPIEKDIVEKGTSNKPKNAMYNIDDNTGKEMLGILNIGTKRGKPKEAQEDSILAYSHPENPDFKIALVADGVGGGGNGDKASYLATKMTMEWFKRLSPEFYNNDYMLNKNNRKEGFYELIIEHLVQVSDEIIKQLGTAPRDNFFCCNY